MSQLTISEVARQVGLRPSAIRYYEKLKILTPARRAGGQRRYDVAVVRQLAVLRRAQEVGFTLEEVRELFFGLGKASVKWNAAAKRKMAELDSKMEEIQAMKELLGQLQSCCQCDTVEQCGAGILKNGVPKAPPPQILLNAAGSPILHGFFTRIWLSEIWLPTLDAFRTFTMSPGRTLDSYGSPRDIPAHDARFFAEEST